MTHLFREEDFHYGQELTMVTRSYRGEERFRKQVKVIDITRGTTGKMKGKLKISVQFVTDNGQFYSLTVLPSETNKCTTLEA